MTQNIIVVCLGTGDPELLNEKTIRTMKEAKNLVLRTGFHPVTVWLNNQKLNYTTLDRFYEDAEDFDSLSSDIADFLWQEALHETVVYAVSDIMTDHTLFDLNRKKPPEATLTVIPGYSLSDSYMTSVYRFIPDSDLRCITAYGLLIKDYNPNETMLITELDNELLAGQVKLLLSAYFDDEHEVLFYRDPFSYKIIKLYEIDRQNDFSHLSALLVTGSDYSSRNRFVLEDLLRIMKKLRAPDGCPWDSAQTHHSLRSYMIEEAWEVVSAINQNDTDHLADELGDLLLQIVFHSSIAESFDEFTMVDVISAISQKMIRRHPQLFPSDDQNTTSLKSYADWEKIKRKETGRHTVAESLDDISVDLPSLKYTSKMIKKLNNLSCFRRDRSAIINDLKALISRIDENTVSSPEDALGNLLYICTELCQHMGCDSELILRMSSQKAKQKIQLIEKRLNNEGKSLESLTFTELGVYLDYVKGEIE